MKKYQIPILILILSMTSCGLFKKTTRDRLKATSEYDLSKVELGIDKSKLSLNGVLKDNSIITSKSWGKSIIYPKPNTKTIINPDGSMVAEVDSIYNEVKTKNNEARDKLKSIMADIKNNIDTTKTIKETIAEELKLDQKKAEPDKSALAIVYAICGLVSIIIVIVILNKFINKPKSIIK